MVASLFEQIQKILAIVVFCHRRGYFAESISSDPVVAECYFFQTCYFQTLALFYHFDERGCFRQRVVCAGVKPCESAWESLYFK